MLDWGCLSAKYELTLKFTLYETYLVYGFPEIYAQLEEGEMGSICHGYMCIVLYMKLIWCNGFPEIYAQLE